MTLAAAPANATGTLAWADQAIAATLNAGHDASVNSVFCVNATFCVAGGVLLNSAGSHRDFVSIWNGTSWTVQEVASALNVGFSGGTIGPIGGVTSVSCASTTFCVAGGSYADSANSLQAFVSTWNGTSWTDQEVAATLDLGGSAHVSSVSCTSATFCVVGGYYFDGAAKEHAFISTWNGASWTDQEVAAALNVGTGIYAVASVDSVSCTSATFCVAGGYYTDGATNSQAFASTWNGTSWTDQEVAATLNVGGNARVQSVSCTSATFCVAGGSYMDISNSFQTFVSTWNGTSWTDQEVAAALNVGTGIYAVASVDSVSCTSATFCVAGGYYTDGATNSQAFASTWNGTSWTDQEVAATLNVGGNARVQSVSCTSATFCVAGSNYSSSNNANGSGQFQALVSTWNGTSWTDQEVAATLNVGGNASVNSVSCASATFCVAGGNYFDSNYAIQALVSVMSAVPTQLSQRALGITNPTNATAGAAVTLATTGGSGTIARVFAVTGTGCSLVANRLSASGADTCVVTATNPANGGYAAVTSAPVTFHFALAFQRPLRVRALSHAKVHQRVALRATGGSGRGALSFRASGAGCVLHAKSLTATRATRCTVRAYKNVAGPFHAATSRPIVVRFTTKGRQ